MITDIIKYLYYYVFSVGIMGVIDMPEEIQKARFFKLRDIQPSNSLYQEYYDMYCKHKNHPMVKWYHPEYEQHYKIF